MGAPAADLGLEPGSSCFLVPRSECPLVGAAGKGAALPARRAPAPSPASQGLVRRGAGRGRRRWQGHPQNPPTPVMRKIFSSWERQSETRPGEAGTGGLREEEERRGREIQGKVCAPGSGGGRVQAEGSAGPGRRPAAPPRARLPSPAGPAPARPPPPPAAQSPPRGAGGRAAPPSGSLPPSAARISYQPSFRTFQASSFQTPGQGAGRARAPGSRRPRPRPPGEWRPPRRAPPPPVAPAPRPRAPPLFSSPPRPSRPGPLGPARAPPALPSAAGPRAPFLSPVDSLLQE